MAWSAGASGVVELPSWRVPAPNRTSARLGFGRNGFPLQSTFSQAAATPPTHTPAYFLLLLIPPSFLFKKQLSGFLGPFFNKCQGKSVV